MQKKLIKKRIPFLVSDSKKGNAITDTLMVMIVLFIFVVLAFVGKTIFSDVNADIQADDSLSDQAKTVVSDQNDSYADLFDAAFITVFILIWALALIASYVVDSNPIFAVFTVILLIFIFVVAVFMGNSYEEFAADSEIAEVVPNFPMANFVMSNLLVVVIVLGFSVLLVLFGKNYFNRGY